MKLLSSDNLNSRILIIFVVILLSAILSGCQSAEVSLKLKLLTVFLILPTGILQQMAMFI